MVIYNLTSKINQLSKDEILSMDIDTLHSILVFFTKISEKEAKTVDADIALLISETWGKKASDASYAATLKDSSGAGTRSVSIEKGVDRTIYVATIGDAYGEKIGLFDLAYQADIDFNRNKIDMVGGFFTSGEAYAWAYTGETFTVSGSGGSQYAYVRYNGFTWADIIGGVNSSATYTVTVSLYEYSGGQWYHLNTNTPYNITTNQEWSDYGGYFYEAIGAYLTPGSTYQVRVKTYGQASSPLFAAGSAVHSWSPDYTMWTSIQIDWQ
ncbi:hypothetical protein DGWBC_1151 [Dehalogenimonas sp. WBC-2]|nr:hypothetical protein DGWBC_1151 [Dehalogenimonas sp. WBC-2]